MARRKATTTTLDQDLFLKIQILALKQHKNANDLLEEGMRLVLDKYDHDKKK